MIHSVFFFSPSYILQSIIILILSPLSSPLRVPRQDAALNTCIGEHRRARFLGCLRRPWGVVGAPEGRLGVLAGGELDHAAGGVGAGDPSAAVARRLLLPLEVAAGKLPEVRPPPGDIINIGVSVLAIHKHVDEDVDAILSPIQRVQKEQK